MADKKNKLQSFPLRKLFPNIVTLIGLCFGLFAIKFAIMEKWQLSVGLIVIAAFLDGIDGGIARLLNASTSIGAQLDSLTDFLNFSVAPGIILYMWITHEIKGIGWAVALFFIICGALRLARFNAAKPEKRKGKNIKKCFFEGIPAPSAAGLSLVPMMLTFLFQEKWGYQVFDVTALLVIGYMLIIATLMVSTIPTLSVKNIKIKKEYAIPLLACITLFITALIIEPWVTLPLMGIGYILTIPYTVISYYKLKGAK